MAINFNIHLGPDGYQFFYISLPLSDVSPAKLEESTLRPTEKKINKSSIKQIIKNQIPPPTFNRNLYIGKIIKQMFKILNIIESILI